jgi:hypothetical protein
LNVAARRGPLPLIYTIAFWSGFFVMAVELMGGRLLAPNFGSSIYVWGAIITVFMLALSLGYLAGGRWSLRHPSLTRLALLLLAAALTSLPVLVLADAPLESLAQAIPDPRFGSLTAAMALFFIPTFLAGMVSPYCVRLIIDGTETSGRRAGQLFFVSTFGSAAGTILTSFYLVLWFEVDQILMSLAAVSVVLAFIGLLAGRRR